MFDDCEGSRLHPHHVTGLLLFLFFHLFVIATSISGVSGPHKIGLRGLEQAHKLRVSQFVYTPKIMKWQLLKKYLSCTSLLQVGSSQSSFAMVWFVHHSKY